VGPTCQHLNAQQRRTISSACGLLGWAGFLAWAGWLARGPFYFFVQTIFLSLFLKQKVLFCNKTCINLNLFKFAKFCKRPESF
jgi:hypothetical protein